MAESERPSDGDVFYGLDIKSALDAHFAWRNKLEAAIVNRSIEGYDVRVVTSDQYCVLGKWIHNEAERFQGVPEYKALRIAHAMFHMVAGEILREIDDGNFDAAVGRIQSDLHRHSELVQVHLTRLYKPANPNPAAPDK